MNFNIKNTGESPIVVSRPQDPGGVFDPNLKTEIQPGKSEQFDTPDGEVITLAERSE